MSMIKAPDPFKKMLREYILYAHQFRHGAAAAEKKPKVSYSEAEAFVYLTDLFIRLVMRSPKHASASVP